ncbi:MAG: hypothetical protein C5S41_01710, partial [Candidatus Methanomarinus sp.]
LSEHSLGLMSAFFRISSFFEHLLNKLS